MPNAIKPMPKDIKPMLFFGCYAKRYKPMLLLGCHAKRYKTNVAFACATRARARASRKLIRNILVWVLGAGCWVPTTGLGFVNQHANSKQQASNQQATSNQLASNNKQPASNKQASATRPKTNNYGIYNGSNQHSD